MSMGQIGGWSAGVEWLEGKNGPGGGEGGRGALGILEMEGHRVWVVDR